MFHILRIYQIDMSIPKKASLQHRAFSTYKSRPTRQPTATNLKIIPRHGKMYQAMLPQEEATFEQDTKM